MASSCKITRDNNGKIVKVLNENGKESKLFNQITELPHVESLEQAVDIYDEILKVNPTQDTMPEVTVNKTDSNNPSFEDMLSLSIQGGALDIGKIKGASRYSILHLQVDANSRKQGKATKLLKTALNRTEGKLSGQATNVKAIGLNYKLGMRAFNEDGGELSLNETEKTRASKAGESINMRLPDSKIGENYIPFQVEEMIDLGVGFYSNTLKALSNLKDKAVKNIKGWMNQLTDFQKTGIKNVKQELDWLNLEEHLTDWVKENNPKNGNIPFSVVEDYIKANEIEIVEVNKGYAPLVLTPNEEEPHILEVFRPDDPEGDSYGNIGEVVTQDNGMYLANVPGVPQKEFSTVDDAREYIEENTNYATETRHDSFQLGKGENYREVLLTMPELRSGYEIKKIEEKKRNINKIAREKNIEINKHNALVREREDGLEAILNTEETKEVMLKSMEEFSLRMEPKIRESYNNLSKGIEKSANINEEVYFSESFERRLNEGVDARPSTYVKKAHWDESNVIAHVRMNERTLPNGERVLFIEEVQSDWAQDGKKRGFMVDPKKAENRIEAIDKEIAGLIEEDSKNTKQVDNLIMDTFPTRVIAHTSVSSAYDYLFSTIDILGSDKESVKNILKDATGLDAISDIKVELLIKLYNNTERIKNETKSLTAERIALKNGTVANMPFKKTDQWVGMAMRKVFQMAAKEGFDRVAWVTGEQSAERYNLSKQVSKISHSKNGNGTYNIVVVGKDGYNILDRLDVKESELEDIVGKEVAAKIVNREGSAKERSGIMKELIGYGRAISTFEKDGSWYVKHENTERGTWINKEDAEREAKNFNENYIDNQTKNEIKELSGLDLEVGGEGMKTFYNSILPKVVKKEAQRFDKKAKVEVIDFRGKTSVKNAESIKTIASELEAKEKLTEKEEAELKELKRIIEVSKKDAATTVVQQLSIPITGKLKNAFSGATPMFSLESGGNKYDNFKEALDDTENKTIDIVSNGKVIATLPSTLDERTVEGVINAYIADGILNPNKITFNGKTYFQTTGETPSDRLISEEFFKETIGTSLSRSKYYVSKGLIQISNKEEEVSEKGSLHRTILDKLLDYFSAGTVLAKKETIDEKNLKLNLMKILSDMGVSVISLKQYQDKFKAKSKNIPPSAEALVDIANRVIAFKEGNLSLHNLTEEVMHLIVETLPKEQLEALTELIKNSEEYQEYYEQYKEIYNNDNALIEKEILGKILKNITLNKVGGKSKSFLAKLMDIIKDFFSSLTLSQSHKDQLSQLNGVVERFVIQQNGENFTEDDLAKSKEIALMYSLSDQVSNTQGAFEKTFKNITDFKHLNSYKRELRNTSFENLRGRELVEKVGRFIEMSTKLIETTDAAIETSKNKRKSLSGQNRAILEDLHGEIASHLDSLAVELEAPISGVKSTERIKLAEKLKENSARISELRAVNDQTTDDHIKQMVEEIVAQMGQAEGEFYREQIEKVLRGEIEDTNKLFSFFGQLHHASNPILNMIGSKIWEMNMKANQGTKEDISKYLNYMQDNKISKKEFESLVKDGYFEDVVDHKGFDDALLTAEMEVFAQISGQSFTDLEAYKKAKAKDELTELKDESYGRYRTALQEKQLPLLETVMNEQYYKDLFDKYDRLNISGATQAFLKQNSADRGSIKANATQSYTDSQGKKQTRVVLSPEDNNVLNSISKIRKARKNIYSEISTLKKGLKVSSEKPSTPSVLLPTGQYLSLSISEDMSQGEKDYANISFDLHKLDNEYMEQAQKDGGVQGTTGIAKANFIAYISSLQGTHSEKEIYDIIMSNMDISLSQDFYDTLNGDSFLKGDTLNELNPDNTQLVEDVKELYAKRNAILSMYRNTSSPFEVDRMTSSDQDSIRSLSVRISNALRTLTLPEGTEEGDSAGEKAPNKAYLAELNRRGIQEGTQEELDFLINSQHTDVSQINRLTDAFNKHQVGIPLSDSTAKMLSKYLKATLLETQLSYAKNNLQPYYTRFAPIGYKSAEERLQNGEEISEILHSSLNNKYLNIRIDNSFEEKDNPLKNPNYDDSYDGGFRQPKKGTFVNTDFISRFGINEQGEATKNKELFEARRLYIEARKKGLEKMNEKVGNPYKVIQISKTTTEKLRTLAKGKNKLGTIKELLKDTLAYRVDDLAYGEKGFQSNKNIPKYYTRELEDKTDVSTDYVYALAQFTSRANEYKAKKEVISDIDSLYDILMRSKRHSKSKDLKNTIAMADSYIENAIYGKIENRTYEIKVPGTDYSIDLAKVSRIFTKYVSLKNLGYNTTVPLTGLVSGLVSKRVEEWIGEKLNRDSAKLANAEYKRLVKDGFSQALDFNDNSKIFLIGQAFGIYDISEKAVNAKYDKFQRTFSKSAMALHTMANYPIIPKLALTVMYDNRIIGDKIMNRQQYFQEGTRNGVPVEQLEADWKVAEEESIYKYMNFTKTGFSWDPAIRDKISDEKYLENRKLFMMKFIRIQVSNVDATLPQEMRVAAQRDAVWSMALLHKGFLSIFLQNRLKKRNLNIDTGLVEEGSYKTLARLLSDFFNVNDSGDREIKKKVQKLIGATKPPVRSDFNSDKEYNDGMLVYELEIRNMRRIGKELASMGVLVTLGAIVFAMATDPDNEDIYALQMSSYLMTRLLNESGTAFTPSILTDLSDVVESPIVTYDTAKEIVQFYKLFDGENISRGKYKGLSVRQRWITKNALGFKGIYDIWGADNIRESEKTYRLYNEENINRATLGLNSLYKSIYKD